MSEKRKDNKGRVLKTGESQRKDGIYQYRYTDFRGKRQSVYASTLQELRQKEKEIQKQMDDGIDYEAGQITVIELLEKYIEGDNTYHKYYDEFVVLLETGMRVSEFCGLTRKDLDFKNRRIRVDHQLVRERGGKYYVEETKTSSGCRFLPMTDAVYDSLKKMLERRPKVKTEPMVDGYSGFIMLDKNGNPKVALHIENEMRWAMKKYKKLHPDSPLPHITPHVFRHTFCTNYANEGMDIKNLQYLMGHSDAGVTLNVYTHASYAHAAEQMAKISQFRQSPEMKKDRDFAVG